MKYFIREFYMKLDQICASPVQTRSCRAHEHGKMFKMRDVINEKTRQNAHGIFNDLIYDHMDFPEILPKRKREKREERKTKKIHKKERKKKGKRTKREKKAGEKAEDEKRVKRTEKEKEKKWKRKGKK